eukprot:TRINITY_DN27655_c0_g1_i1.p1 TRINITY_DN27655_c0_g1~~TRINITY_DN27655_c0_g1_i1.p1  ORF type:complete len:777 (-),score=65.26 TRINITY_DN27655_c0_g1_i1:237-2567(-)
MAPFFVDVALSTSAIGYFIVSDVLGVAIRPCVVLATFFPAQLSFLSPYTQGGLLVGALGTSSIILMIASGSAVTMCKCNGMVRCIAMMYLLDGFSQLPRFLRVHTDPLVYPSSRTGISTLLLQIPVAAVYTIGSTVNLKYFWCRYNLCACSVCLRFISVDMLDSRGPTAVVLSGLCFITFTFAITPRKFWSFSDRFLRAAAEFTSALFSFVYLSVQFAWPQVKSVIVSSFQLPLMSALHRCIVAPFWRCVTPCVLPAVSSAIAASSVWKAFSCADASVNAWLLILGHAYCGAAAALSSFILLVHAVHRIGGTDQIDPLYHYNAVLALSSVARSLSFPCGLVTTVIRAGLSLLLRHGLEYFGRCLRFAVCRPVVSILAVMMANVALLKAVQASSRWLAGLLSVDASSSGLLSGFSAAIQHVQEFTQHIQEFSWTDPTSDSTFALLMVAVSQMVTYRLVGEHLRLVQLLRRPDTTGEYMQAQELNSLAETMDDPRQCGRCAFGPVDTRGCANLRTHHGRLSVPFGRARSGSISNACPRCNWFVSSLRRWPQWDGAFHTTAGQAVFRMRTWSETVLIVRAASKALAVPFALLQLGKWMRVSPSLSAFLAISYLVPWSVVNMRTRSDLRESVWARQPRTHRRHQLYVPTADGHLDADTGAAPRHVGARLPNITKFEALATILAVTPDRVFLSRGENCSVCLDKFTDDAHDVAVSLSSGSAAEALRALSPPVIALLCGHPLHLGCAEAAVAASTGLNGHLRCPLCREPATLMSAASARAFS